MSKVRIENHYMILTKVRRLCRLVDADDSSLLWHYEEHLSSLSTVTLRVNTYKKSFIGDEGKYKRFN